MSMMIHRNRKRKNKREISGYGLDYGENLSFSDSGTKFEERPDGQQYTKTDINKMSTMQLQKLAAESGIENANEKNGGELKKLLIEKFSL